MFNHGFIELVKAGGFTIAFIVLCSVLVLAIAIERIVVLWSFLDRARSLFETVKRCLYRGAIAEARAACERSNSPAAELFLVGFERYGRSDTQALEAAVDRERQRTALALKGPLWLIGTIGAVAPFIGLFGTVWGIMRAFNEIGLQKKAGIEVVGPGIAEALVTTAFGIAVGIAAVAVYNYFSSRLARLATEVKLMAEEFVELLREQKQASVPATDKGPEKDDAATAPSKAEGKPMGKAEG